MEKPDEYSSPIVARSQAKRLEIKELISKLRNSSGVPFAYLTFCALMTLACAQLFYSSLVQQTHGEWAAPLDDVFIYFDYARSTARGFPFQWSQGNGFSSGATSWTYPLILALGYRIGFQGSELMVWAAIIAAVAVLCFLWSAARLFQQLPPWTWWLAPVSLFSVGALAWSLWSGMEIALFLGVWGATLVLALDLAEGRSSLQTGAWLLGMAGALTIMTRPEGVTSVVIFGVFAALQVRRTYGGSRALQTLVRTGLPSVMTLAAQAGINRICTGEFASNGAISKLFVLFTPYATFRERVTHYFSNLQYVPERLFLHHLGEPQPLVLGDRWIGGRAYPWGYIPLGFALIALLDVRTRRYAALLLASSAFWVITVSLNDTIRWQNERYLMPAVAWLLIAAALGLASLVAPPNRTRLSAVRPGMGLLVTIVAILGFWRGEREQYRYQVWFFGRASRNIRDQQIVTGRELRALSPRPTRVLVNDAGAIMYASEIPGFDLIGLGGYHKLPIARAGHHGQGALLELIERLPPDERPDLMAIYPAWWGPLPTWFGQRLFGVTARGNVVCAGDEKVVYRADWSLLDTGKLPRLLDPSWAVIDEVDIADLLSEQEHDYRFPQPHGGKVDMRVLADPANPHRDLWDAGRTIPEDRTESMTLHHLVPTRDVRIVLRITADASGEIGMQFGSFQTVLANPKTEGWRELIVNMPGSFIHHETMQLFLTPHRVGWTNYHLWAAVPKEEI